MSHEKQTEEMYLIYVCAGTGRNAPFYTHTNRHQPRSQLWECSVHPNITGIETDTVTTTERNCFLALILRSLLQVLTW